MNTIESGARVVRAVPVLTAVPAMPNIPVAAYPRGRWTLFRNPFAKRPAPAVPVTPVQGELVLDLITPVRNDLSDSDLELVPAQATAPMPPAPTPSPAPVSERSRSAAAVSEVSAASPLERRTEDAAAWDRVKEQLFGAGRT